MSSGKVQIYFHLGSKLEIPNTSVAAQLETFSTVVKTRLLLLLIEDARSSRHPLQKYKRKLSVTDHHHCAFMALWLVQRYLNLPISDVATPASI